MRYDGLNVLQHLPEIKREKESERKKKDNVVVCYLGNGHGKGNAA